MTVSSKYFVLVPFSFKFSFIAVFDSETSNPSKYLENLCVIEKKAHEYRKMAAIFMIQTNFRFARYNQKKERKIKKKNEMEKK